MRKSRLYLENYSNGLCDEGGNWIVLIVGRNLFISGAMLVEPWLLESESRKRYSGMGVSNTSYPKLFPHSGTGK